MVVTDLYAFKVIKSLELLDREIQSSIEYHVRHHQRVSFSLTPQQEVKLFHEMRFLHRERLVLFYPTSEEHEPMITFRAIPMPKLQKVLLAVKGS